MRATSPIKCKYVLCAEALAQLINLCIRSYRRRCRCQCRCRCERFRRQRRRLGFSQHNSVDRCLLLQRLPFGVHPASSCGTWHQHSTQTVQNIGGPSHRAATSSIKMRSYRWKPYDEATVGPQPPRDYTAGEDYDKRNLVAASHVSVGDRNMTYFMVNQAPPNPTFYRGLWRVLEQLILQNCGSQGNSNGVGTWVLTVVSGNVGTVNGLVQILRKFTKIVCRKQANGAMYAWSQSGLNQVGSKLDTFRFDRVGAGFADAPAGYQTWSPVRTAFSTLHIPEGCGEAERPTYLDSYVCHSGQKRPRT